MTILALAALPLFAQDTPAVPDVPANELVRAVVANEVKAAINDQSYFAFQLATKNSGKEEIKAVVQTRAGDLDRMLSINGQPLTPEQQKHEARRIQQLLSHPDEQHKRLIDQRNDEKKMIEMMKLLPDALLFSYAARRGRFIQLTFLPNPTFHPHSREARVLNTMAGEIWVDKSEDRIAEISGKLTKKVEFGGGFLGHLDQGGTFHVLRSEMTTGQWVLTLLNVQMKGKALFFKTIAVQQKESRWDFRRVSSDITLAAAAKMLSSARLEPQARIQNK
jgi:hypothetical protein